MRSIRLLLLLLLISIVSSSAWTSEGFDDLATLIKVAVNDDVVLEFIKNSPIPYTFNEDETQYLADLGASSLVIDSALNHGKALKPTGVGDASIDSTKQESVAGTPALTAVSVAVDDAPLIEAPPDNDVTVSYFYKALAPFGKWIDVDGESVWQPEVVKTEPNWRPYCNHGSWISTDQGWAWNSDYAWGWAAFHYGRWHRHGMHGYVWTPGTVWAPAWVAWRESDTQCGWAPLPSSARFEDGVGIVTEVDASYEFGLQETDYCFAGSEHFCDGGGFYFFGSYESHGAYGKSKKTKHSCNVKDNKIIVNGPSTEKVAAASGKPVKMYAIADARYASGETMLGSKIEGEKFSAFRPAVKNVVPVAASVFNVEQKSSGIKKYSGLVTVSNAVKRLERQSDAKPMKADVTRTATNESNEIQRQRRIQEAEAKRLERQAELKTVALETKTQTNVTGKDATEATRIKRIQDADEKRTQRQTASPQTSVDTHSTQASKTSVTVPPTNQPNRTQSQNSSTSSGKRK